MICPNPTLCIVMFSSLRCNWAESLWPSWLCVDLQEVNLSSRNSVSLGRVKILYGLETCWLLRKHLCVEVGFATDLRTVGVVYSARWRSAFASGWSAPFVVFILFNFCFRISLQHRAFTAPVIFLWGAIELGSSNFASMISPTQKFTQVTACLV